MVRGGFGFKWFTNGSIFVQTLFITNMCDAITSAHHPFLFIHVDVTADSCTEDQEIGNNVMKIKWNELAQKSTASYKHYFKQ